MAGKAIQGDSDSAVIAGPRARKARPIRLAPHVTGANAFRHILATGLDHLVENEPAAIVGSDPEGIHQARVATRRLRSALALFEDYAGFAAANAFRHQLQETADVLGEARDWDVFLDETLPLYLAKRPDAPITSIRRAAIRECASAHRLVRRTLTAATHDVFLAELRIWIVNDLWRSGLGRDAYRDLDLPCRKLAGPLLDGALRKIKKLGAKIEELSLEQIHDLRKALKRFRYGVEFLGCLYLSGEVRTYAREVGRLQDIFGVLNDAVMVLNLTERPHLVRACDPAELEGLRRWAETRHIAGRARVERRWKRFKKAKPFWG